MIILTGQIAGIVQKTILNNIQEYYRTVMTFEGIHQQMDFLRDEIRIRFNTSLRQ